MIRAVADTHTIIWYLFHDPRLSETACTTIEDAAASGEQVAFSAITLAEIVYLAERGRIRTETLDRLLQAIDGEDAVLVEIPFDRAIYRQWRCYWPFGSGMFTDLFVHRTTAMLKATGLRFPARVVGAGGIYLELDTRDVPDVATVVADYREGCQGLITATMCNERSRVKQVIRGQPHAHSGTHPGLDLSEESGAVSLDESLERAPIARSRSIEEKAGRFRILHRIAHAAPVRSPGGEISLGISERNTGGSRALYDNDLQRGTAKPEPGFQLSLARFSG